MRDNLRASMSGLVSTLLLLATFCFTLSVSICEVAIASLKVALCWVGRTAVSLCDRVPESVWLAILAPPYCLFVALPGLCIAVPALAALFLYIGWQEHWANAE
jgi:hypothetical protein